MKSKRITLYFAPVLLLLLIFPFTGFPGKTMDLDRRIRWNPDQVLRISAERRVSLLTFQGSASGDGSSILPFYIEKFKLDNTSAGISSIELSNARFIPLPDSVAASIADTAIIGNVISVTGTIVYTRKNPFLEITLLPLRRDPSTRRIERLVSFSLRIILNDGGASTALKKSGSYASNSVLAVGNWFKVAVASSGVYAITYDYLKNAGIDVASINPKNIRVYGNGGGMLPEANAKPRADDLTENAIYVSGEEDGKFDEGDYILFYGDSPDKWTPSSLSGTFQHQKNLYSDKTCYFLNFDTGPGMRIGFEQSTTVPATDIIDTFNDYAFYEKDDINLIKSGREWWDAQIFDVTTNRKYSFTFPNIVSDLPAVLKADVAARSTSGPTLFNISAAGAKQMTISIPSVGSDYTDDYASEKSGIAQFTTSNPVTEVTLEYKKQNSSAVGWLNYLEMNVMRQLKMAGSQLAFRSFAGAGTGKVSEFRLTSLGTALTI
ncbi:MAG: hypothetical protein WCO93_09990, partial [bacterium]